MTQKLLLPVPNTVDADRAKALLESIRRRVSEGKVSSHQSLLQEALAAIREFYLNLSEPTVQERTLNKNDPRDPEEFNLFGVEVKADLDSSYNNTKVLTSALVSGFNYTTTLVSDLRAKLNRIASKGQDLQHAASTFTEPIIVAGDDFTDTSKIDRTLDIGGDESDILPGAGAILHRAEAIPVTDGAEIQIQSNHPLYEGKLYALDGEAEPEGGTFHFRRTPETPAPTSTPEDYERWHTAVEWMRRNEGKDGSFVQGSNTPAQVSGDPQPLPDSQVNLASIDGKAGAAELKTIRERMLDGNADSYWQGEVVLDMPGLSAEDLTYQELLDLLSRPGVDSLDLEVTITLKLKAAYVTNFLLLNPLQTGDGNWLEVTDISTSADGNTWEVLEGLHDHNFENTLTDEANEELTREEVAAVLAPNKYQYAGMGVWTFPAREIRYIRVTLLQKSPSPAPYDVLVVQLQKTVTDTVTKEKNKSFMSGLFK